jgi:hypothetical protein
VGGSVRSSRANVRPHRQHQERGAADERRRAALLRRGEREHDEDAVQPGAVGTFAQAHFFARWDAANALGPGGA